MDEADVRAAALILDDSGELKLRLSVSQNLPKSQ